jgi:hypothetical protein
MGRKASEKHWHILTMPHFYNFDGFEHKLYILKHLTFGAKEFCAKEKIYRTETYEEWIEYLGHIKSALSETAIEAAVKIRMVQDFVRADDQDVDLDRLDRESLAGLTIGTIRAGSGALSLRDSCNKIIHATDARLSWEEDQQDGKTFEYWDGSYYLTGTRDGQLWEVEIHMADWCTAMMRFIVAIQHNVDWHRVHKYDE